MKKYFFYLSLAVITATCMTACGDDEDDAAQPAPVTLKTPANAEKAVQYSLQTALEASSSEDVPALQGLNFTESGKMLLELRNPEDGKLSYIMEDATLAGNVYTLNGSKARGTVTVVTNGARSRATGTDQLIIDLSVTYSTTSTVTYTSGNTTVTVTTTTISTGDEAMDRLARTWKISGAILDLRSKTKDIKAYEEFDSRGGLFYLEDVLAEALDQNVNLSPSEQEEFKRVVKSVTITKSGVLTVDYADGTEDVAGWQWANTEKTAIRITLKDEEMGNKFFSNDSKITVAFSDTRCNLKLDTSVKDNSNSNWEVSLTLKLYE